MDGVIPDIDKAHFTRSQTFLEEQKTLDTITSSPEYINPIEESFNERLSSHSKVIILYFNVISMVLFEIIFRLLLKNLNLLKIFAEHH
jgi:hypothetical protein